MSNCNYFTVGETLRQFGKHLARIGLCLALIPAGTLAADPPTLAHVSGIPTTVDEEIGMSGDGQWAVWMDYTPPEMTVLNLTTGLQTTIDLNDTTNDPDLNMDNVVFPVLSEDGSVVAVVADGNPGNSRDPEIVLVLDRSGNEIARVWALDAYGGTSQFSPEAQISADGRYVVFSTDADRIESFLPSSATPEAIEYTNGSDDDSFRLDTQTGALERVSIKAGGGQVNDNVETFGISGDGRYVLFGTDATDVLPGGNNDQLYVRDMSNSDIERVSVNENGDPVADVQYSSGLSDNGSRVLFTESNSGSRQVYSWTRDIGSKLIHSQYHLRPPVIAGNSFWMTQSSQNFSRINLETGSVYPLLEESFNDVYMDDIRYSSNGEMILFRNEDLTTPGGDSSEWWTMTFAPLIPITVQVDESITTQDSIASVMGINISVEEVIHTDDILVTLLPITVWIDEVIHVNDDDVVKPPTPLIFRSGFE